MAMVINYEAGDFGFFNQREQMWPDDKFWLPKVLSGKKIKADFVFKKGEIISSHNIQIVNRLN